jgi:hypothetical protein
MKDEKILAAAPARYDGIGPGFDYNFAGTDRLNASEAGGAIAVFGRFH